MLKTFTDQIGNEVTISVPAKRIVSLVPSQTELLFDLGLTEEVIGITKFCVHPEDKFKSTTKIGGTKTVDITKVRSLKPDLIIGNKEENIREQIEELSKGFNVWLSDVNTLDEAKKMITQVGELVGRTEEALVLITQIEQSFASMDERLVQQPHKSVAYLIWKDPFMAVGRETFIDHMLNRCGLKNSFSEKVRYPEVSIEELQKASPDLVFLSTEPYPFKYKHVKELEVLLPKSKVMLVDGEMFSWYGSRLKLAPRYFENFSFFSLDLK